MKEVCVQRGFLFCFFFCCEDSKYHSNMPTRSECLNLYQLADPYTKLQVRDTYRTLARRFHPDKAGPEGREQFEAARSCKDSLEMTAEDEMGASQEEIPRPMSAPSSPSPFSYSFPSSRLALTYSDETAPRTTSVVPYRPPVSQRSPIRSRQPGMLEESDESPFVRFNSRPDVRTFGNTTFSSSTPSASIVSGKSPKKTGKTGTGKKVGRKSKSAKRSPPKCNRGNRRGSRVVKGYHRKSGQRVLCYKRRKSVRK